MTQNTSSTQSIIDIERIQNDFLILKNGGLRKVLLVSGINFDLKSEEEKDLIVFAYQNFLNSLDFSIQILIHTRKLNIANFLKKLDARKKSESNNLLKNMIADYRLFINNFVSNNPIMSKTFFVIVPYDPIQIPKAGEKIIKKFFLFFNKKKVAAKVGQLEKNMRQLELRVDQVAVGLNKIGLRAVPLAEPEIIELFYNFYNPTSVEKRKINNINVK